MPQSAIQQVPPDFVGIVSALAAEVARRAAEPARRTKVPEMSAVRCARLADETERRIQPLRELVLDQKLFGRES